MMGMQTMGSQSNAQESHLQPSPLAMPSSWYDLSLEPVGNQIDGLWYDLPLKQVGNQIEGSKKSLDNIILEKNCTNMLSFEASKRDPSSSLLQRQGSSTPPRALKRNTVDEVWEKIHQVQKKSSDGDVMLEDFLGKSGASLDTSLSLSSSVRLETSEQIFPQCFTPPMALSPSPSIGSLSGSTVTKRQRAGPDEYDNNTISRRLKRMMKNRESAARSRERKQAYQSELLARISCLEEENSKLKKEKEFDAKFPGESPLVPKYRLRRTNSGLF